MSWLIPERFSDDACRRHGWWLLLALTTALYLPGLGTLPLMDRDEPRFAHATVEMMDRDSWVVPYFNSDPAVSDADRIAAMNKGKGAMEVGYRFDKPPLTYWWMRLHYALFGVNEMAARLHSVVSVWLVALVVFALGNRLVSARAGLTAGIAWITTLQVMVHGRLCVADMPMVLFVTVSCRALMELLLFPVPDTQVVNVEPPAPVGAFPFQKRHWILYASLGAGFLAKGPIAWLVPGLALLLWRFGFWRRPGEWRRLRLWPGILITLAMVAGWGIPAMMETHGMFWKVGMGEHVVKRGTTAFNGRFPIPGYYLVTAFASLFPWIALLPQVWSRVRRQWDAEKAFLVSWLVAPYVIFSLYATQLPHYVMPGFPAAMVLMMSVGELSSGKRWHFHFTRVVVLGALLLLVAAIGVAGRNLHSWDGRIPAYGDEGLKFLAGLLSMTAGWLFLVLISAALLLPPLGTRVRQFWKSQAICLACLALVCGIGVWWLSRCVRVLHPAAQLAAKIPPLPADVDLVGWQYQEPSMVYYCDHHWKFLSKMDAVSERMNRKGPRVVVLLLRERTLHKALREKMAGKSEFPADKDFTAEVDALIAGHPDYQVCNFSGLNFARTSWAELRMLIKKDLR